jgi:glycosyltransferase involved in cell wall biosynthesis
MATVTVFVPTWNRPDMIAASIDSALAQTFEDFVVLVGDNGGSPLTEGIVRGYDDPRVRYIRHERNLGGMGNWLELIRLAETPLVASLHDDDTWEPTFLEKAVPPMLADPEISMVFCDFWCVDAAGDRLAEHSEWLQRHSGRDRIPAGRFTGTYADGLRMAAVWGAPQPAYAAVLRRRAVLATDFPDEIAPVYDLWLVYQVLRRGEGFAYVPERLTNYRVWGGSLTAKGYGPGQDAVYSQIVADNQAAGPVLVEVQRTWADERYGRGRALFEDPTQRLRSQIEMTAAAPHLSGRRRLVAQFAGTSTLGWHLVRLGRSAVRSVRSRLRPGTLSSSGLVEANVRPNARAHNLKI